MISKEVLRRKEFFCLNPRCVFRGKWIELPTRGPGNSHIKKNEGPRRKFLKTNLKGAKILFCGRDEVLNINSKTGHYLLSCLGSTPAKAHCVVFETTHFKWDNNCLFNEHGEGERRPFTCPLTSIKNTSPFIESPEWTTKECFIIWRLPAGLRSISLPF